MSHILQEEYRTNQDKTANAYIQENVLGVDKSHSNDPVKELNIEEGPNAAKEPVDTAAKENIEEFLRYQNRSSRG